MKLLFTSIALFLCSATFLLGQQQSGTSSTQPILGAIELQAKDGKVKALRDLGTLLGRKDMQKEVNQAIRRRTILSEQQVPLTGSISKEKFLSFYYDNADSLSFSPLLNIFYLQSLHEMEVKYETKELNESESQDQNIKLRLLVSRIGEALDQHQFSEISNAIESIVELDKPEGYQYLMDLLTDNRIKKLKSQEKSDLYYKVSKALVNYPDIEAVELILRLTDSGLLKTSDAVEFLSFLTNIHVGSVRSSEQLLDRYSSIMDSLPSLNDMRHFGYRKHFSFQINFFEHEVDYYGKLLNESAAYPWIQHNAYRDLMQTTHPRSLFYLATQIFKINNDEQIDRHYLTRKYSHALKQLTRIKIGFKNKQGKLVYTRPKEKDIVYQRNQIIYWSKHFEDYEWDDNYNYFTNKYRAEEITQNYERLFRRLNSKNDSVAIQSFVKLTEGEALKVIELAKKYRQLLRSYNSSLPSFKNNYLEQLVLLTDYCKKNNFSYKLPDKLVKIVDELKRCKNQTRRFDLENKLIKKMDLAFVTALEYQACLNEKNIQFNYSIGRVLDYFYSKHWSTILENDNQLRLYLKKASLFENIGVFGTCNNYLVKFNIEDQEFQSRLNTLGRIESDEDVLNQMAQLVSEPMYEVAYSLNDFMEDPGSFDKRDINTLPAPSANEIKQIIDIIQAEDAENIRKIFVYLRLHPSVDIIPDLFRLIDDQRPLMHRDGIDISVADFTIPVIENAYNYNIEPTEGRPFNTEAWQKLWKSDGKNYLTWTDNFFEESLVSIQQPETLSIDDINAITESPNYRPKYKKECLQALKKVRPLKDIKRLIIEPRLSVSEDLIYFEDFFFNYKDLDDILKLFEIKAKDANQLLDFVQKKSAKFSYTEKGSFYNNLFRQPWMSVYINSPKVAKEKTNFILGVLNNYLDESDYLSEYEEQTTYLYIAQIQNIGLTTEQKLQSLRTLDIDAGSQKKIREEIIANIGYKDLAMVAEQLTQTIPDVNASTFKFINKDFGLPVFNLHNADTLQLFLKRHRSMDEATFYHTYLKEFGVDYLDKKGKLDFNKIYKILQFDIVTPFVNRSGGRRDYFTYGLIKILELHFEERLGFHEKLNENQTFYSFSSVKRANAWRKYLRKKKLVQDLNSLPPSFSRIPED